MKTVAIIPGFAEGPWHSKGLCSELRKQGYAVIDNESQADIIISHSAGCYFIPNDNRAEQIVLIGPPYWPGKPLAVCFVQKVYRDFIARHKEHRTRYWFQKSFWNVFYVLGDLRLVLQMARNARKNNWNLVLSGSNVTVIRNTNDAWCSPEIHKLDIGSTPTKYCILPGEHDDLWVNTMPYIDALTSVAK